MSDVPRGRDELLADSLVAGAVALLPEAVLDVREALGEITLVLERARLCQVAAAFKEAGYRYLVDVSGVDYSAYPAWEGQRFAVSYHLYSHQLNGRVRLKVFVDDGVSIPSVTGIWKTANWHEREVFDMYGVVFDGHPNLERILTWDGFNGHPLRKDFPLRGVDTGARIYPEIFPAGGGPKQGSTGKPSEDVNLYQGEWDRFGIAPLEGEGK